MLFWVEDNFGIYVDDKVHGFVSTTAGKHWFEIDDPSLDKNSHTHYFAMTYDESTQTLALYLDGNSVQSADIGPLAVAQTAVDLHLGHAIVDFTYPKLTWTLYTFRISSNVLTADDIGGLSSRSCGFQEDLTCPIHADFTNLLLLYFKDYSEGDILAPDDTVVDHSHKCKCKYILS